MKPISIKFLTKLTVLIMGFALGCILTACNMAPSPGLAGKETPDRQLLEIETVLQAARAHAGDDFYLKITQGLQCHELGRDGKPIRAVRGAENLTVPPTKIFDNLFYLGGSRTGSWLIPTDEGHILIDSGFGNGPEELIIPAMKELGFEPEDLRYILITHPGPDHVGGALYFQDHFGTRILMAEGDWKTLLEPRPGSWQAKLAGLTPNQREKLPPHQRYWVGPPRKDLVGVDGQKLTLGKVTVTMVSTPRRFDGGGLSYIVPVTDNGKPHMWATYGNTGAPRTLDEKRLYRKSVANFLSYAKQAKVDSIMSSHPFVDGSVLRIKTLEERLPGTPHPFVIGEDGARRYINILDQCAALWIARNEAGLDDFGETIK